MIKKEPLPDKKQVSSGKSFHTWKGHYQVFGALAHERLPTAGLLLLCTDFLIHTPVDLQQVLTRLEILWRGGYTLINPGKYLLPFKKECRTKAGMDHN